MKRRNFLLGAAGFAFLEQVGAVTSCPPSLASAAGGPVCPIPEGQALSDVVGLLSTNSWGDFSAGTQSYQDSESLAWQTDFYHDPANERIHLLGKPHYSNTGWTHQYFDLRINAWVPVTSGISSWNQYGHIYGGTAFDEASGDLYQNISLNGADTSRRVHHFRHSSQSWDSRAPTNSPISTGSLNSTWNGLAWHPNLYGSGDGGLVIGQPAAFFFWRKSTDTVDRANHPINTYGGKEAAAIYWPAKDAVIIGGSGGNLAMVTSNGSSTPTVTKLPPPPVRTAGESSLGSGFGSIHVHPGNPNKIMIVESVGQRTWTSTNGSTWTRVSDHPFDFTPRVVCSLKAGLGCLWAVGRDTQPKSYSRLWRPAV